MNRSLLAILIAITICSCKKYSPIGVTVSKYKPILIDESSLANSVVLLSPSNLQNPGKYIISGNYLYVVEKYKGVHVFNNTDPSKPLNICFVSIPGIETISILNNILCADNSIDMVGIDISNPANPSLVWRLPGILPQPETPDGLPLDAPVAQSTWPPNSVVVDWVKLVQ